MKNQKNGKSVKGTVKNLKTVNVDNNKEKGRYDSRVIISGQEIPTNNVLFSRYVFI